MLEWYRLDADYRDLMADCEKLFAFLQSEMADCSFPVQLALPWQRLTVEEAFQYHCPVSARQALEQDQFDQLLVEEVEPNLGQGKPTFLYDYPLEMASLARPKPGQPELAERFELYVSGVELANGFSELTDPELQRSRFEEEYVQMGSPGGKMPEQFLKDLGRINHQAAGIAMGLDRLFMLFLGKDQLDDAITFSAADLDR